MGRKKPYSSIKNRRSSNYNYGSFKKNNKYVSKRESFFKEKKSLENTTKIRIDKDRLNDFDSLDTSFLEGRRQKKITREVKPEKRRKPRKKVNIATLKTIRNIFYFLGSLSFVILIIVFFFNNHFFGEKSDNKKKEKIEKQEEKVKKETEIDTNYLFIGGYHTDSFALDDLGFLSPYVKNSEEELFTSDILDSMKKNIYDYNPSLIFFEIGISDYVDGKSEDEILQNIEDIIRKTKDNRPYAEIYVESFYPINKDVEDYDDKMFKDKDNKDLVEFNKKLKSLCKSSQVHYLDIYSELVEKDKLNDNYTDDGVHLNENGYKRLFKIIRKIVDSK